MHTITFLQHILPAQGQYIASVQLKKGFLNRAFSTIDELAAFLLAEDAKGKTVYHACASYELPPEDDKVHRTQANSRWVRSQWLDIDVGPGKDYATRKEAKKALVAFCKKYKIPAPTIVSSGRGLHCYWTFTRDYPVSDFTTGSTGLLFCAKKADFKHDVKRTKDSASVLRPVGTHHRKGTPTPVTLLHEGKPVDPDKFYAKFDDAPAKKFQSALMQTDGWGSGSNEYPPSSAKEIVKKCSALREFGRHKASDDPLPEDYWRGMLGLLKHTVEGEKLAHHWSKQSDSRYDESETQAKLDGWRKGPTTCDYFSDYHTKCATCPLNGKITSPITLGYSADQPPKPKTTAAMDPAKAKKLIGNATSKYAQRIPGTDYLPFWHQKYAWDGEQMLVCQKKDGVNEWIPFSKTLYYPFLRYETEDNTRAMMLCALTDPKRNQWRIFQMDTAKAADSRQLANSLGAQEIVYMSSQKERNQRFVQDILSGLREHGLETTTYSSFGWHEHGFVIGDRMITKKGTTPVFLSNKVPHDLQGSFGKKGTVDGWVQAVDEVYNRPGAEPYQFTILTCLASPLVYLCRSDLWHGIPEALTGESGTGKSTAALVGCSIWGNPKKLMIQANEEGTTLNALLQRVGVFRHLPILLDEITGRSTEDLQALLFALSNGEPKRRLRPDGTEIHTNMGWDTLSVVTANMSMVRTLADAERARADATQVRVFEIALADGFNKKVFKDVNGKEIIEKTILSDNHGTVGEEFIRYVIAHRDQVEKILQKERAKLGEMQDMDSRERFYYDLIATVMVAAGFAKKLGLIHFDLKALRRWALNHVASLRTMRSQTLSSPEDFLQAFLSDMHLHTVVTKFYRDGRQKAAQHDNEVVPQGGKEPLARLATEDRRFLITRTAFNNWCRIKKVAPDWLLTQLEKLQCVLDEPVGGMRQRIFKGTSINSSPAACIELNYEKIDSMQVTLPDYISVVEGDDQSLSST